MHIKLFYILTRENETTVNILLNWSEEICISHLMNFLVMSINISTEISKEVSFQKDLYK